MDCTSEREQIRLQNQIKEKCGNRIIKVILEPVKLHLRSSPTPTQSPTRLSDSGKNSLTKEKESSNLETQESECGQSDVSINSDGDTGLIGCSDSNAGDETNISRTTKTRHRRSKKLKNYAEVGSSSSEEGDAEVGSSSSEESDAKVGSSSSEESDADWDSQPISKKKTQKIKFNFFSPKTSPASVPSTSRSQSKSRRRNLEPKQAATCEICTRKYSSVPLLEHHILTTHVMDNPFECDVCYKAFISERKLTEHNKTHYNKSVSDFPYICSIKKCIFVCKTKNELKLHFSNTHINIANNEGSSHFCPFCDSLFENDTIFEEHLKVSTKLLKCEICQEATDAEMLKMDTQCNLNQHVKDKHPKKKQAIVKTKVTQKEDGSLTAGDSDNKNSSRIDTYHCDSRSVKLPNSKANPVVNFSANVNIKLETQTSENSSKSTSDFKCLVCEVSFSRRSELNIHEKLEDHQRWKCPACPKLLKNKWSLKMHLATIHSDARPVKCEHADCDKSFKNRRELLRHRVVHSGSGSEKMLKHKCDKCTKSFMNPASLLQHLARYHGGERPFKCPECPKAYAVSWELREHSVSHSDKTFQCDVCQKRFASAPQLKQHSFSHTDQRPFPCKFCDATYKFSGQAGKHQKQCEVSTPAQRRKRAKLRENVIKGLKRKHGKIITVSKEFQCDVCQKIFPLATRLKQHLYSHTDQRPFSCKFCDATYKSPGHAGEHQKKCQLSTPAERRKRAKLSQDVINRNKRKREKTITVNEGSTRKVADRDPETDSSSTTATLSDTDKKFKAKQEVESNSSDSDHDIFVEKHSMEKFMFEKVPKKEEEK